MPTMPFLKQAQLLFIKSLKRIQTFFVKLTFRNKLRLAYISVSLVFLVRLPSQLVFGNLFVWTMIDMIGTYISSFFYNDMRSNNLKYVNVFKIGEYEGCLVRLLSIFLFILCDMITTWKDSILYSPDREYARIVKRKIEDGADVNEKDNEYGATPLHHASATGNLEVVQQLIKAGADVNAKDNECGATPLHHASYQGHLEIVQQLIKAGADVKAKAKGGGTPLGMAKVDGHTEIVNLLIENGAIE